MFSFWIDYLLFLLVGVSLSIGIIYCVNREKYIKLDRYDKAGFLTFLQCAFILSFLPIFNILSTLIMIIGVTGYAVINVTRNVTKIGSRDE